MFLNCQLNKMVKNITMYTFYRKLLISPAEKYGHTSISHNLFSLTPQSIAVTSRCNIKTSHSTHSIHVSMSVVLFPQ
jgi:hypothetical protein